jgi:hypothetical protein
LRRHQLTTDKSTDTQVEFTPHAQQRLSDDVDPDATSFHTVDISGLTPSTT